MSSGETGGMACVMEKERTMESSLLTETDVPLLETILGISANETIMGN